MPNALLRHATPVLAAGTLLCHGAPQAAEITLPAVQVSETRAPEDGSAAAGYYTGTVRLGPLGETALQDTPFSIDTVSAQQMANLQASNVTEALRYLPGVYVNTGASQMTPYFTLRGFSASTWTYNMAVDGMRSFDIYQPLEDKERIEVLQGASAFLYGITSPAGTINYVTKRPAATPATTLTTGFYDAQFYTQLDRNGAISDDLAYRVNLGYGNDGTTGADHQSQERYTLATAFDWRATRDTRLSLDASYARRQLDYAQAQFVTSGKIGVPKAPDTTNNWGAPYDEAHDVTSRITLGLESRLNDTFKLRARYRHSEIERAYTFNRMMFQNTDLDYKWRIDSQDKTHIHTNQYALFLDAGFATGPVRHELTLGATQDTYTSGFNGARRSDFATVYPGALYGDPVTLAWSEPAARDSTAQETTYSTVLVADNLHFSDAWSLLLGASHARVDDTSTTRKASTGALSDTNYTRGKTTPVVALSYRPISALTAYASYSESLQQGFTAPTTAANAGEIFAPYVGRQTEVGAKGQIGGLHLALAHFRIAQANQYTDATTNVVSQDGEAVHKGWEFSAMGKLTDRLTLTGGLTSLDAKVTKATANVGKTPQGVPELLARLYAEYALPAVPGLTFGLGASHTGKVPVDAANLAYVPSVTVYDASLRYENRLYGKTATWRFGVTNLFDKDYWTTRTSYLYFGSPRTIALSLSLAL